MPAGWKVRIQGVLRIETSRGRTACRTTDRTPVRAERRAGSSTEICRG